MTEFSFWCKLIWKWMICWNQIYCRWMWNWKYFLICLLVWFITLVILILWVTLTLFICLLTNAWSDCGCTEVLPLFYLSQLLPRASSLFSGLLTPQNPCRLVVYKTLCDVQRPRTTAMEPHFLSILSSSALKEGVGFFNEQYSFILKKYI